MVYIIKNNYSIQFQLIQFNYIIWSNSFLFRIILFTKIFYCSRVFKNILTKRSIQISSLLYICYSNLPNSYLGFFVETIHDIIQFFARISKL